MRPLDGSDAEDPSLLGPSGLEFIAALPVRRPEDGCCHVLSYCLPGASQSIVGKESPGNLHEGSLHPIASLSGLSVNQFPMARGLASQLSTWHRFSSGYPAAWSAFAPQPRKHSDLLQDLLCGQLGEMFTGNVLYQRHGGEQNEGQEDNMWTFMHVHMGSVYICVRAYA